MLKKIMTLTMISSLFFCNFSFALSLCVRSQSTGLTKVNNSVCQGYCAFQNLTEGDSLTIANRYGKGNWKTLITVKVVGIGGSLSQVPPTINTRHTLYINDNLAVSDKTNWMCD